MKLNFLATQNNVGLLTRQEDSFSTLYLQVRKIENRMLSDAQVKQLPHLTTGTALDTEWRLRQKSSNRFLGYLAQKKSPMQILDLGCGNGWFTHQMSVVSSENNIVGIDVNLPELEQAARVFIAANLQFVYAEIFALGKELVNSFDLITLNAAVQYFPDFTKLFSLLKSFLTNSGELHILDSPFYEHIALAAAKERSRQYYTALGYPDMANLYYHHSKEDIKEFELLFAPGASIFSRLARKKESPFPWLRYTKGL